MKLLVLLMVAAFAMANENAGQWKHAKGRDMSKYIPLPLWRGFRQGLQKANNGPQKVYDFSDTCGKHLNASRIVGGEEAVPHSIPWQVGLFTSDGFFCGGSLFTPSAILTAAHCGVRGKKGSYKVILGGHEIRNPFEDGRIEITATEFVAHENWSPVTLENDIAIIKLDEPVELNEYINVACLANEDDLQAGDMVTASGWGLTSDQPSQTISPVLQQVQIPVVSNDICKQVYGPSTPDNIVCLDTTGGHGTCSGDSGGPLHKYIEEKQQWENVGVTSFGARAGCEKELPVAFTRISLYKDWISEHTGLKI